MSRRPTPHGPGSGLAITLDVTDGSWREGLRAREVTHTNHVDLGVVPDGMVSGRPSVFIRIDDGDGRTFLAEVSLELLSTAVDAIRARHGDGSEPSPHPAATPAVPGRPRSVRGVN